MMIRSSYTITLCLCVLHSVLSGPVFYENDNGSQKPTSTMRYDHVMQLDVTGDYWMFWTANETHIIIETHTRTNGYVGFGLSSNGKMFPADVVVGWVDGSGQAHLHDYHTVEHSRPLLDTHQDWTLLYGSEDQFGTVLKFVRKLKTCDDEDRSITDDTVRVIYSYHDGDPVSETDLPYHGTNRGAKSALLLSNPLNSDDVTLPSDTRTFDFLNENYHVPAKPTTYHRVGFQFPRLDSKHHIVMFEPIVQSGNEMNVHHIALYACDRSQNFSKYDGYEYVFDFGGDDQKANALDQCINVFLAWAIGGGPFYYPANAGVSLGTDEDPTFFLLETHYDNPSSKADIVDNSGFRIHFTPTLRFYDVGILLVGVGVSYQFIIPPGQKEFVSQGFCDKGTLSTGMAPGGINVFGVLQHSHLLGRSMRTRLFRNGTELEPIAEDLNYDFNYQEIRGLKQNRLILPGDSLEVDCVYNSMGKKNVTYGGLSTRDEMCESFLLFYPRIPLNFCFSDPTFGNWFDWMPDRSYNWTLSHDSEIKEHINNLNWEDPAVYNDYYNALHNNTHLVYGSRTGMTPKITYTMKPLPKPTIPYVRPQTCKTN